MLSSRVIIAYRPNHMLVLNQVRTSADIKSVRPPNPKKISSDMIGPPDPVSNLRKIVFKQQENETALERRYREMRSEVQDWNHNFWTRHNSRFFQEREEYLKRNLPEGKQNLTADEMSVFYKAFLDKNWSSHINYNKEWYKKNFKLLGLAIQVKLKRMLKIKDGKYNVVFFIINNNNNNKPLFYKFHHQIYNNQYQ